VRGGSQVSQLDTDRRELALYIDNDYGCHRAFLLPTLRTVAKHYDKGQGDYGKALLAISRYAVLPSAREYVKVHGSMTASVKTMFPKPIRDAVAEDILEYFLSEYRLGNKFWEA